MQQCTLKNKDMKGVVFASSQALMQTVVADYYYFNDSVRGENHTYHEMSACFSKKQTRLSFAHAMWGLDLGLFLKAVSRHLSGDGIVEAEPEYEPEYFVCLLAGHATQQDAWMQLLSDVAVIKQLQMSVVKENVG
jgi:hypothetical protein